jgi:hypothetical protein
MTLKLVPSQLCMTCLLAGFFGGTSAGDHPNRLSLPTVNKTYSLLIPSPSPKKGTNWSGPYPSCGDISELLKQGPMDLGVRITVANPRLAVEIRRALYFWSGILDMTWYKEDDPKACAIGVVDGLPDLFNDGAAAKAQFPDWTGFQGLIAFDPRAVEASTPQEMYLVAVHELGHLWGIEKHSKNVHSIMYFQDPNPYMVLDGEDLARLRARHSLPSDTPPAPIPVVGRSLLAGVRFKG